MYTLKQYSGRITRCLLSMVIVTSMIGCGGGGGAVGTISELPHLEPASPAAQPATPHRTVSFEDALISIEALEVPAGVAPAVFDTLRETLAEALKQTSKGRFTSVAPSLTACWVNDLALQVNEDGSVTFNWSYANAGDYDQSSEVNISDLSVLGQFWGATTSSEDWTRARVADGDDNGEVNIADVVPIGSNFLATFVEYVLYGSMDPENPDAWETLVTIPFDNGTRPEGETIKVFSTTYQNAPNGMHFAVGPAGVGNPGDCSHVLQLFVVDAGTPQNLAATQGTEEERVDLTWDELADALLYEVYRSDTQDGEYEQLSNQPVASTSYSDFNVEDAQHHWYKVSALMAAGYTEQSEPAEGWALDLPGTPENVNATDGEFEDSVEITWDPVFTAVSYQISRSEEADGSYTAIGNPMATDLSDETGDWGIGYFYKVQAINAAGVSLASEPEAGHRGNLGQPPVVTNVSPLTGDEGALATFEADLTGSEAESYLWDFNGAANTSTQASPTVSLGAPGSYDCSLTVANAWGGDQFDFQLNINAENSSISEVTPTSGIEHASVTFTATHSASQVTSWAWDFGGGATPNAANDQSPVVTLGDIGTYGAAVTLTNDNGDDTFFFTLEVIGGIPNITEVEPTEGGDGENVSFSATNTGGSIDTWAWDFGGGATPGTSTLASPTVTLGPAGNYNCSVTATNGDGSHQFDFTLNVVPAKPQLTNVIPTSGIAGSAISPLATNTGGEVSGWSWYFGDGATPSSSPMEQPTITLGEVGAYSCSVVATNVSGSVIFPFTLTVTPPPPDLTDVAPNTGVAGATIQPSATNTGGEVDSWAWDFGGGATPDTSTSPSPTITLGDTGTYSASVTATNGAGSDVYNFSLSVNVSAPELVGVEPQSGFSGASAQFTASNTGGAADTWAWDFGGGATPNTSTDASPTVTLGSEGSYNCTVVATNASGSDTLNFTLAIDVAPPDLTAVSPIEGVEGTEITISATNAGGVVDTWAWDFGGGATPDTSTEGSPTITLGSVGTYNASVIATNSSDNDTFDFTLTVNPAAPDITAVTPLTGTNGANENFTATNVGGAVATWAWDFDGGATPNNPTDESPTVTLGAIGTYNCSVTVTNVTGSDVFNFTLDVT